MLRYFKETIDAYYVNIKVIPNSRQTEFFTVMSDGTLKIRIKRVPEKWKANVELISFLSEELKISKDNISIIYWNQDQYKMIKIKKS